MNPFLTAIAITSTLILTQGCFSPSSTKFGKTSSSSASQVANTSSHEGHVMDNVQKSGANKNPHEGHNMEDSKTHDAGEQHHDGGHSGHSDAEPANAIAKLTVPSYIAPTTPVPLVIEVQNKEGKSIADFDKFQEQLMHLIVVSDNLQYFNHIHPTYKGNGHFEVQTDFPGSGGYTLFSDYKPAKNAEQVSVLKMQVPGQALARSKVDMATTKTLGNTKANLTFSQPQIKAGQGVNLIFNLQDASSNQPLKDLQPYLGERGHLVILKQSLPLTKADYIHAHALKDTPAGEVHFMTSFPQPGKYKLWGQFNRNGQIVTADFWVNVE
ncbi:MULTISPECIES: hypothetical protein [unclassified Microcoleus]|jgi:hypothetical protein|uniref:hypothetical protein n=1 Tax=unclassified Microcoleus TaxID=2642155 RepID=UPI002FD453FD